MRVIAALGAGLVAFACGIRAQSAPSQSASALLDKLVGHWRMVGHVGAQPVAYDMVARRALHDRYVELHMTDVARPARYEALVYIGEDTVPNRVVVHWIDSFGAAFSIPYGQGAVMGDTVQFEIPYPGVPFRDAFVYRRADNTWHFRLESNRGGDAWKLFAEYEVQAADSSAR